MTTTPERGHKLDPTEGELPGAADVHGMHGGSAFSAKPGQLRCGDDRRAVPPGDRRSEEHTSELQSRLHLVCRLLLEKKNTEPRARSQPSRHETVPLDCQA